MEETIVSEVTMNEMMPKEIGNEINRSAQPKNGEGAQQCTHCKVFRLTENFMGKRGPVKQCLSCRERDDVHKKIPEIVAKRNARQRETKNYVTHRQKKRSADEDAFLKKNAENAKNYRENNKERVAAWNTQNFAARFRAIKQQAINVKNIPWDDNLTDELCYQMMTSPCHYCHFKSDTTLNGIDRMDNTRGYTVENCVGCCGTCNFMKGSMDPITFLRRCFHISHRFGGKGAEYKNITSSTKSPCSYWHYQDRAERKQLEFQFTKEEFQALQSHPCHYCGVTEKNGIDRKDNAIGYTLQNCVSCCGSCNYLKGPSDDTQFIEKCQLIATINDTADNILYSEIKPCDHRIQKSAFIKNEIKEMPNQQITITKQQPSRVIEHKPVPTYVPKQREYTRKNNLPPDCGVTIDQIPKFCYYRPASGNRSDGFCCEGTHPKQQAKEGKCFTTSRSVTMTTREKFDQLIEYLNQL
jgi:hypothetical protein